MLLREIKHSNFYLFDAMVQVRQPYYSQWISIQVSAKSAQSAKLMIHAQYGSDAKITGLRKL